jgi:hypothetical protein
VEILVYTRKTELEILNNDSNDLQIRNKRKYSKIKFLRDVTKINSKGF